MKNKLSVKIMSLSLALLMAGTYVPMIARAAGENPEVNKEASSQEEKPSEEAKGEAEENKITKDETVYVNLNPDGSLREVIITDKIHSDVPDIVVEDKTNLINLEVIKGGSIKEQKDGSITWQLEGKDLYYRGVSTKELPFNVNIRYFLDGKEMKYDKMAGKSGDLKITVDFKNNLAEKVDYKGRKQEFSSPMGIAAVFSLPTDKFTKVEGEDVAITTEGDNTMVAVACVPGLYKSLNLDENKVEEIEDLELPEHFEITCHVDNFEMGSIALTATGGFPESEDELDLSFIDDLDENLKKVKRIRDKFESMDDDRTLRDMLLDDEKLSQLQSLSKDIDELLSMNTEFANNLGRYVTKDAVDALSRIIEEAEEIDLRYLKDFDYAEKYEDKHNKPVSNKELGKGIEKSLELFDVFDLTTLGEAYDGMKELKANEAALTAGCVKFLSKVAPGEYNEAVLSNMPLETLLPIVAGYNLFDAKSPDHLNHEALASLKEQIVNDQLPGAVIKLATTMLDPSQGAGKNAAKAEEEALKAQQELEALKNNKADSEKEEENKEEAKGEEGNNPSLDENLSENEENKKLPDIEKEENKETSEDKKTEEETDTADTDKPAEAETRVLAETNIPSEDENSIDKAEEDLRKAEKKAERAARIAEAAREEAAKGITIEQLPLIMAKAKGIVEQNVDSELRAMLAKPDTIKLLGAAQQYVVTQAKLKPMMDATIAIGEFPRDAYLRVVINNTRNLYNDFLELYPTIQKMKKDLENDKVLDSFKHSPEMVDILVRMKKQLDENTELSDALRKLQDDENIEIVKDIVSTLDEIDRDKLIEDYTDKINKLQDMVSRKDILKDMADSNTCYTDKGENMETSYKFVLKTDEIKAPKEVVQEVEKEEVSGIRKFFANLFK